MQLDSMFVEIWLKSNESSTDPLINHDVRTYKQQAMRTHNLFIYWSCKICAYCSLVLVRNMLRFSVYVVLDIRLQLFNAVYSESLLKSGLRQYCINFSTTPLIETFTATVSTKYLLSTFDTSFVCLEV